MTDDLGHYMEATTRMRVRAEEAEAAHERALRCERREAELREAAEAERDRLAARVADCEEALEGEQAEFETYRERMVRPLADREHVSRLDIESLSWDDLLALAVRNLNFGLDLDRRLQQATEALSTVTGPGLWGTRRGLAIAEQALAALQKDGDE